MHHGNQWRIPWIAAGVCFLMFDAGAAAAGSVADKKLSIMGKVTKRASGQLHVGRMTFMIERNTRIFSQTRKRIKLSDIREGGMVNVAFREQDGRRVAEKVRYLDAAGSGRHRKFTGKILKAADRAFELDGRKFAFDEFTIRLGDTIRDENLAEWLGVDVTVIALKGANGIWQTEVIREGIDLAALAR